MKKIIMQLVRAYISPIGLKVVLPLGLLLFGATLFNLFQLGGWFWAVERATDPLFWLVPILTFVAFTLILSKVVILPLKKFELYIRGLRDGMVSKPIVIKQHDEIGYLASRFNDLQAKVTRKMELKDLQFSVLSRFLKESSGIFEVETLMDHFFKTLSTAVDFDVAYYLISTDFEDSKSKGRVYSNIKGLSEIDLQEITSMAKQNLLASSTGFPIDSVGTLGVTELESATNTVKWDDGRARTLRIPIDSFGKRIGTVSVVSTRGDFAEFDKNTIEPMAQHVGTVLEKLHAFITSREKRLESILSSMSDGVFIVDSEGQATTMNSDAIEFISAFCHTGIECLKGGFGLGKCPHGDSKICEFGGLIKRVREGGIDVASRPYAEEVSSASGRVVELKVSSLQGGSEDDGYVIVARDITSDRMMQKQLFQSSKLAALGEMAAGIAHEVNNPLQTMMGNVEVIEYALEGTADNELKRIAQVKGGIQRIKKIIHNLLIFAREESTDTECVDITPVLMSAADMLKNQFELSNVLIELDLDQKNLDVQCNINLLQQVVINLLQNARDAIVDAGEGSIIKVRTSLLPSNEVVIEIADDGPGISHEAIEKIFDPFFTTKDVGKGTGLGLSVSRKIVECMNGVISVTSRPGEGTTFYVTLKHANGESKNKEEKSTEEIDIEWLSGKKVLMVDDEVSLTKVVSEIATPVVASFEVASKASSALARMEEVDFDIMLMDIKMPVMDGMELYKEIKERKPYMAERIIFVTGDTESEKTKAFLTLTGCRYISKPFEMEDLFKVMSSHEEVHYEQSIG